VKRTDATVLPRWIGFDELQREYTAHVDIPGGIADVRIDTTYRLADAYQLNNSLRLPFEAEFDSHVRNAPERKQYEGFVRPDLWYNGYDGVKAGVHFHSDWMRYKHKLWFTVWLNTGFAQNLPSGASRVGFDPISFNLRYENGTERLLKNSRAMIGARYLDGLEQYSAGFFVRPNGRSTELYAKLKYFVRRDITDLTYLVHPAEWELNALNGALDMGAEHRYDMGVARINLRSSSPGSVLSYSQLTLSSVNEKRAGRLGLRLRAIAQYGTGDTPRESQLYLAAASPEEMMENKYYRSAGLFPYDWQGFGTNVNPFAMGGGLGLRGYAGYLAPETMQNGNVFASYRGNTGAAVNAELDLDGLVHFRPGKLSRYLHLDVYLFGDIGSMGYRQLSDAGSNELMLATPRADAGAGAALTIKRFGPLDDIEPLTIRVDMPLVLSNLPAGETEHFAFRYLLAIGRSF
jgi:aminopeptidase N